MDNFYHELEGFSDTAQIVDNRHYQSIPDDWFISVIDVRASTEAIKAGRYRDVNFVGAAAITSHLNLISRDLPFMFGGDGATILIKKSMYGVAQEVLQSLSFYTKESFDFDLHAGLVPVSAVRAMGRDVKVAKYLSGESPPQAMFKGGGVSLAESLVKSSSEYRVAPKCCFSKEKIFAGLSCRWKPIPSSTGVTLSILVQPMQLDDEQAVKRAIAKFESLLGTSLSCLNPINMQQASYESFFKNFKRQLSIAEIKPSKAFFAAMGEVFITVPLFRFGLYKYFPQLKNYMEKISTHCDFHKYDDTLRMVINCSEREHRALVAYLESEYEQQQLFFGVSASDAAQMTCHVESIADGEHLHFIDGSDGGYAMAAIGLKNQLLAAQQ
ncbi:DUF3095 family protein [Neptuniibacter sp. 1_MG-2023]|uniref:DUF3095 family protein n=1 Tax=Neptuniibacter sp. 1_MG-2023 TaxID=3062662 RepID=UPI0026E33E0D|nr:DUF3095 family protein [Neptuniibacter sp. 1_MG-2023]MDO6594047.1 DUF3095 family protein [Neptuniibacter sp. 1_MG-2023]